MPPVIYLLQGGPGGVAATFGEPPQWGIAMATPPKLRIDVKLPCKSIVISSQSGPFIRWRSDGRSYV